MQMPSEVEVQLIVRYGDIETHIGDLTLPITSTINPDDGSVSVNVDTSRLKALG